MDQPLAPTSITATTPVTGNPAESNAGVPDAKHSESNPSRVKMKQALDSIVRMFTDATATPAEATAPPDPCGLRHGLSTGLQELDQMIAGLRPGNLFVVAARPGMGKTSLMLKIAGDICMNQNVPTLIFSGQMTVSEIMQRLVFERAGVPPAPFYQGNPLTKEDVHAIQLAVLEWISAKLSVDDTRGLSIETLSAKARRAKQEDNIGFIAIDCLQSLRSDSPQAQVSREREVAEISAGLKSLALELEIPILVLANLNRRADSRVVGNYRGIPRMSDLRESGAIEQDADMVGLLYRPSCYAENAEEKEAEAGEAELILTKNRNGKTGWVPLLFIEDIMRFDNYPHHLMGSASCSQDAVEREQNL